MASRFNPFSPQKRALHEVQRSDEDASSGDQTMARISAVHRQDVATMLEITIQAIQAINDLVPINIAKNVLTGVTRILLLCQKWITNKDDLKGLVLRCEDICSTLAHATRHISMDQMSDVLLNALSTLESSINELHSKVEETLQHGSVRRFFSATIDEKQINSWSTELDRIFGTFNTKLNINSGIRLEQVYYILTHPEVQNLMPDPPPSPPAMFFGREELFSQVKDALLRNKDVALIGPGGIGKSSIAKAIINDDEIEGHYRRRFFVTFDGMDRTKMTLGIFVQRVASSLGLPVSGAECERQVKSNLKSSPVLLVLDNAETFEDVEDPEEASRIESFVTDIANARGISVILTSRTRNSARKVRWTRFTVPPLKTVPARQYFREIYDGGISDDDIDTLLGALDFHPLSIHILAYTAEENQWTGKELLSEWHAQQSGLLQTGHGKENLEFTIRLSLNSPSVRAFGDDALRVLRVIAFLPQGINRNYVTNLFPSISQISPLVDTLCKVSLVYRSGPFLTTLAPIRLFLIGAYPTAGLELLGDIRRVYYDCLEEVTTERDSHADLVVSDHLNIERLIAFDAEKNKHTPGNTNHVRDACSQFLDTLRWHKPHPTSLARVIHSFPEDSELEQRSKASCLKALGWLSSSLSNYSIAEAAYLAAGALFVTTGRHNSAADCYAKAATSYSSQGHFSRGLQLLQGFINSPSWGRVSDASKAEIYFTLDCCKMCALPERELAEQLFLYSMNDSRRRRMSLAFHWVGRMCYAHNTPEETQTELEDFRSFCMSSSNEWDRWRFLGAIAEATFLQRRFEETMGLLDEAQTTVDGNLQLSSMVLRDKAAIASTQGDYEFAGSLLQRALDTLGVVATPTSTVYLRILYVQGRTELYAGNYTAARELFSNIIVDCDICDEIGTKTWCMRAIGEAEALLGHRADSDRYFSEAVKLCQEAGMPPNLLCICFPMMKIDDDRFPRWKTFLQARATTS